MRRPYENLWTDNRARTRSGTRLLDAAQSDRRMALETVRPSAATKGRTTYTTFTKTVLPSPDVWQGYGQTVEHSDITGHTRLWLKFPRPHNKRLYVSVDMTPLHTELESAGPAPVYAEFQICGVKEDFVLEELAINTSVALDIDPLAVAVVDIADSTGANSGTATRLDGGSAINTAAVSIQATAPDVYYGLCLRCVVGADTFARVQTVYAVHVYESIV